MAIPMMQPSAEVAAEARTRPFREGQNTLRYFEDIEEGETRKLGEYVPTREEIIQFASAWDPQPFHTDEEKAADSVFGGLTASSCHTYSISALIYPRNPTPMAVAAMLGLSLEFPEPVRPGDTLQLEDKCLEKRVSESRPGFGVVKSRTTMKNGRGKTTFVMDSSYLVHRRPIDAGD